ncbi:unnamed protein product, partial [Phaeothamnion confervicola]
MYSFAQRPDTEVHDEPLYAHFLRLHDNDAAPRTYRQLVMASQCDDGEQVVERLVDGPVSDICTHVVFMKHMGKQIRGLSLAAVARLAGARCANVLLVRDPLELLPSHNATVPASLEETGFVDLAHIYSLLQRQGKAPVVVDAGILRQRPEAVLRELCGALGIPFYSQMLHWPAGPKPYDGCWAHVWYHSVHQSTGFTSKIDSDGGSLASFPSELMGALRECLPFYNLLRPLALQGCGRGADDADDAGCAVCISRSIPPSLPPALPQKRDLLVWVKDRLVPREMAAVSVFDSAVQGGDAVWEGLRVYNRRVFHLDRHLCRLRDSAKALAFADVPTDEAIQHALFSTLAANGMHDGAHVRLTLTRGEKTTSSMNPAFNLFGCTLIVLAEFKPVGGAATYDNAAGIKLITAATRRNPPQCLDSKIHHCNLLNNILPKIQANAAGAADALMLDVDGFVSETNATNVFMIKGGVLLTPLAG